MLQLMQFGFRDALFDSAVVVHSRLAAGLHLSESYEIRPGHRVRVAITSSSFPRFDRNSGTGNRLGCGRY